MFIIFKYINNKQHTKSCGNKVNSNQNHNKSDCTMKILLLGNSGAGKSCLLMRFTQNKFTPNYYNTIGVDYVYSLQHRMQKIKIVDIQGYQVKMQIWDTAGQDRFKNITSSYYRGADGIVIIYDITDRLSFDGVQGWLTQIQKYTDPSVKKILVGNKVDLNQRRQVPKTQAANIASKLGIPFIQASARDGNNVNQVFIEIGKKVLDDKLVNKLQKKASQRQQLQKSKKKKEEGCC